VSTKPGAGQARVFLAKLVAERDPYVGTTTTILVDVKGRKNLWLSEAGDTFLSKNITVPKAPTGLKFKSEFLEDLDVPPKAEPD
jgi:hypothetical protein